MVLTFSGPGVAARERFQQQSAMRRNELRDAVENAILRHGEGAFRDPPSNLQENSWTLSSGGSGDTSGGSGRARGRRLRDGSSGIDFGTPSYNCIRRGSRLDPAAASCPRKKTVVVRKREQTQRTRLQELHTVEPRGRPGSRGAG